MTSLWNVDWERDGVQKRRRDDAMLGDTLYLDNLQEFVQDESRIVSYKWLSRKLEVPADAAKRMLYAYVKHCRSSQDPPPNVIYTITGLMPTDNGKIHRVCLVREDEVEAAKEQFDPVRSIHIYSVQHTKLKDSCTLFSADYDMCKEHVTTYSRWSPIDYTVSTQPRPPSSTPSHVTTHTPHHHTATGTAAAAGKKGKRESSDGGSSKSAKNSYQFPKLSGIDGGGRGGDDEGSEGNRETTSIKDEADDVEKDSVSKVKAKPAGSKTVKPPTRKPEPKKGGGKKKIAGKASVASFFNKPAATATATVKKEPPRPVASSAGVPSPVESCTSDLLTSALPSTADRDIDEAKGKPKSSPVKVASKARPDAAKVVPSKVKRKAGEWLKGLNDSDIEDGSDSDSEVVMAVTKKAKPRKNDKTKRKESDSTAKVKMSQQQQRKRKRIQNMSSDEEENGGVCVGGGEGEGEEGGRREAVTSGRRRRRRVKRLKSRMYTTEDGAMVTEKVWESESTDDSEPETRSHDLGKVGGAKESPVRVKPEQCSPSKGTKQASLMSFFRK